MHKKIYTLQPVLIVTVIVSFLMAMFIAFNIHEFYTSDFILVGLLFVTVLVAVSTRMVYGLILAVLILFFYGSIIFFKSFFSPFVDIHPNYVWLVAYPVLVITFGYLGDIMSDLIPFTNAVENERAVLVTIDKVSGLKNKKSFLLDLESEMAKAKRHNLKLSAMSIEIQYIEELIDLHGKEGFKTIILLVSKQILKASRVEDHRYRISDKAFTVIMPHTDLEGAEFLKARIKEFLRDVNVLTENDVKAYNIEVRIGIKEFSDKITSAAMFFKEIEKEVEYDN